MSITMEDGKEGDLEATELLPCCTGNGPKGVDVSKGCSDGAEGTSYASEVELQGSRFAIGGTMKA